MDPDDKDELELNRLFQAALELRPERRRAFLEKEASRPEMVRAVETILLREVRRGETTRDERSVTEPSGRGPAAPAGPVASKDPLAGSPVDAERVGPYRIVEELGSGGMGVVYLAEQEKPVARQVALKVIKHGMDTRQVVARFEAERQALALMDHPAIARVYSAGATPRGRPYFAMEVVRGEPITTHCDRERLPIRDRLALFVEVCEAVQHAHHKTVIHRDLKPSNVLVSVTDDPDAPRRAMPKIIDFGIAKATTAKLTEETIHTKLGAMMGTPAYMSPEQADGRGKDVDTRTDVYALGAILYELLVGATPFDVKALLKDGPRAFAERIRETEAPRLSSRLSTQNEDASTETATQRGSEPRALRRELIGDLEWITLKALAKERRRRYSSPREFAADIERYLADQPIQARPPSALYQVRKLVQRHRGAVAAAILVLSLLIAYAVSMGVQARRVATERDRANVEAERATREAEAKGQVSAFLQSLFSVSDPSEARGETVTARELLDRGAERLDQELRDQPQLQAEMMSTIGLVYAELGLYPQSEALLNRSRALRTARLGSEHPDVLASALELSGLYYSQARYVEAEQLSREVREVGQRVFGDDHPLTLRALVDLANSVTGQGRFAEAETLERQVLDIRRATLGDDHPDTLAMQSNLANTLNLRGNIVAAEALLRQSLEAYDRVLGGDHPETLRAMNNLAISLGMQGRFADAEVFFREIMEHRTRVLGEDHPDTLDSRRNLALLNENLGRHAESERLLQQVVDTSRRVLGDDHANTLTVRILLGASIRSQGRSAEAETLHRRALEDARRAFGENDLRTTMARYELASSLIALGRYEDAEPPLLECLRRREELLGPDNPETADAHKLLGDLYSRTARHDAARDHLSRARETRSLVFGERHHQTVDVHYSLATLEASAENRTLALDHLRRAIDLGFDDARIHTDPLLAPLRDMPELASLIAKIESRR